LRRAEWRSRRTSGKAILIPYEADSFWGIGIRRRNLFWLSDEQWERIEPHLPTDVRGVERVDDRRVISGIVHVLKSGCRWCARPNMVLRPQSITGLFAGRGAAS
jgi:hypothetical protein